MKSVAKVFLVSLFTFLSSCDNSRINPAVSDLMYRHINIPLDKLEKRECSYFKRKTDIDKEYTLIVYLEEVSCVPCEISELSKIERENRNDELWNKLHKTFIVNAHPRDVNTLYTIACGQRIENDVFFDTCGIFRKNNPVITDSKVCHSFILDSDNKVILVGNPFKNSKLKELFSKVVKEEMTKRR